MRPLPTSSAQLEHLSAKWAKRREEAIALRHHVLRLEAQLRTIKEENRKLRAQVTP